MSLESGPNSLDVGVRSTEDAYVSDLWRIAERVFDDIGDVAYWTSVATKYRWSVERFAALVEGASE